MDVLSLPLYGSATNEALTLYKSQFRDISFSIPTLSKQDVLHGQQVQVLESSDSEREHLEDEDDVNKEYHTTEQTV